MCLAPVGSEGLGNTKTRPNASLKWIMVLNNYTEDELSLLGSEVPKLCNKYIIGFEKGNCGTPHLQGYLHFKKKTRPIEAIKLNRIHYEKAKGDDLQNLEYCSKEGNVFLQGGFPKPLKILSEELLFLWQKHILEEIKLEANDRSIIWYVDKIGGRGKSVFTKYLVHTRNALLLSGKGADMKYCLKNYIEKTGEPNVIIIDIPRSSLNYISYTGIEEIKNGCFCSNKYESSMVLMNCPHIYIFANELPDYTQMSADRWDVRGFN